MATSQQLRLREIMTITKVQHVCRAILQAICTGEIRPGDRLVEAAVAKQLGVSQATVNQALSDLHSQGIVKKDLNRATTVSLFGATEIEALFSVREPLECMAAAAAARNLTEDAAGDLQAFVEQMRAAAGKPDLPSFVLADYGFHQAIYRACGNQFLYQACQAVAAASFAYILCGRPGPLPTDCQRLAGDHQEVLDALLEGPEAVARVYPAKLEIWRNWSMECAAVER